MCVFKDILEKKKMEDDLKRSNIELEQFAYAVSHNMHQPFRMIASYLKLVEVDLKYLLGGETSQYMKFVLEPAFPEKYTY